MVAIKVLAKELSVCLLTSWSDNIYCPAADGRTLGRKTQPPCSTELCPAANTPPCMHKQMGISRRALVGHVCIGRTKVVMPDPGTFYTVLLM